MRSLLVCLSFIALFSLLYVEVFVLLVCCVFFSVNNEPVITDSHHMVEPPALLLRSSGEFHEDVSWQLLLPEPDSFGGSSSPLSLLIAVQLVELELLSHCCWPRFADFCVFLLQKYRHHDEDSSPQDQSSPQLTEEAGGPELVQVAEKNLSLIENVHGYVTHAHISPMKVGDGIVSASRLSHWSKRRLYWLLYQTVSEPQPSFQTFVRHSQIIDERCIIMFCSCSK